MILTKRQKDVLKGIAGGSNLKTIALEMNISHKTADFHKASACRKLGLKSTVEIVHFGISKLGVPLLFTFLLLFALASRAAEVTLEWDAPVTTPAITNYFLYTSTQPITNKLTVMRTTGVTNATTVTISNLARSTMYHFVAVSREGTNESAFSNPTNYTTPALPAPVLLRIGP